VNLYFLGCKASGGVVGSIINKSTWSELWSNLCVLWVFDYRGPMCRYPVASHQQSDRREKRVCMHQVKRLVRMDLQGLTTQTCDHVCSFHVSMGVLLESWQEYEWCCDPSSYYPDTHRHTPQSYLTPCMSLSALTYYWSEHASSTLGPGRSQGQ